MKTYWNWSILTLIIMFAWTTTTKTELLDLLVPIGMICYGIAVFKSIEGENERVL